MAKEIAKTLDVVIIKQTVANKETARITDELTLETEEAMKLVHAGKALLKTPENIKKAKEALAVSNAAKAKAEEPAKGKKAQ